MPGNPWLAVDVTTSPVIRARELRRTWDEFIGNGHLEAVRLPIAESWRRSQAAGIDPSQSRAPTMLGDRDDIAARLEAHPLEAAAPLVREWLGAVADDSEHLIVVRSLTREVIAYRWRPYSRTQSGPHGDWRSETPISRNSPARMFSRCLGECINARKAAHGV
jgi:hypothetical protein